MPSSPTLHLRLVAEESSLAVLAESISTLAEQHDWPDDVRLHVDLVLEELVLNVISYGYPDGRSGWIDVSLTEDAQGICLLIEDDGDHYNPFSRSDPDLTLPLMERTPGGLGVHFIRQFMDDYHYQPTQHGNRVALRKFWRHSPEQG